MFGRKRPGDSVGPEDRQKLLAAYREATAEVEQTAQRLMLGLSPDKALYIPPDLARAFRDYVEHLGRHATSLRERMPVIQGGTIVLADLQKEMVAANADVVAADGLITEAVAQGLIHAMIFSDKTRTGG
ncbi:hypothetical protein [Sphingomonas sp. KR3-1]|uniref:hypothetical protein n=1 Tax=Sphingomonas sp. KR3-1 TaxID=3156611 RepID=UPI0032B43E95